jgi:hypothetical protein
MVSLIQEENATCAPARAVAARLSIDHDGRRDERRGAILVRTLSQVNAARATGRHHDMA